MLAVYCTRTQYVNKKFKKSNHLYSLAREVVVLYERKVGGMAMSKGKTVTITIRIDESLYNEIENIREAEDRNRNQQIINLIKLGKTRYEKIQKVLEGSGEDDDILPEQSSRKIV
jgi:hypothetical protein